MFGLTVLLSIAYPSPLESLGHEEWAIREKAERSHNALSALLLPHVHENPEIRMRIASIKRKHLSKYNPLVIEGNMFHNHYELWIETYWLPGMNRFRTDLQMLHLMRLDKYKKPFTDRYPPPDLQWGYLVGTVLPGELERLQAHLAHYRPVRSALPGVVGGLGSVFP